MGTWFMRMMLQRCGSRYHSTVYRFISFTLFIFSIRTFQARKAQLSSAIIHSNNAIPSSSSPASAAQYFTTSHGQINVSLGLGIWCQLRIWRFTARKSAWGWVRVNSTPYSLGSVHLALKTATACSNCEKGRRDCREGVGCVYGLRQWTTCIIGARNGISIRYLRTGEGGNVLPFRCSSQGVSYIFGDYWFIFTKTSWRK